MHIRPYRKGDEQNIHNLVVRVFDEYVAPGYGWDGVREFHSFIVPEKIAERAESGDLIMVAEEAGEFAGIIELLDLNHISLLFVDGKYQGKGIARELIHEALSKALRVNPEITRVTVNSSPNSVTFYQEVGFDPTDEVIEKNGIRFRPMKMEIDFG